jgi:hypothetical protein
MTTYFELPRNIEIGGVVHVTHFRGRDYVILQNYSATSPPTNEPLIAPGGIIQGSNQFKLYEVLHTPGEELGELLGTYSSVDAAMRQAAKLGLP